MTLKSNGDGKLVRGLMRSQDWTREQSPFKLSLNNIVDDFEACSSQLTKKKKKERDSRNQF